MRRQAGRTKRERPISEELERRLLMSADLPGLDAGTLSALGAVYQDLNESQPAATLHSTIADQGPVTADLSDTQAAEQSYLSPVSGQSRELVFVDQRVPSHQYLVNELLADISPERNVSVVVLDTARDGVAQVTEILSRETDVDAIHFVSHGAAGTIQLADSWLRADNVDSYAESLSVWRDSLSSDADLLFYGCDLAGDLAGRSLVDTLADLTGADVAASEDVTGHARQGGDWVLEYRTGIVESKVVVSQTLQQSWQVALATQTVRDNFNSVSWSGNNGSVNWSGDWQQIGEFDSAGSGDIRVTSERTVVSGNALRLQTENTNEGVRREVDLSGADTATLSFWYRTDEDHGGGRVTLSVSDNGGGSWTTLQNYTINFDTGAIYQSFDISSYKAADTQIRFLVTNKEDKDKFYADDIQIEYTEANNAPTASDSTVTTNEDTTYTFLEGDFNYSDADLDPLNKIQITSLPTTGSLELSGVGVTVGQEITKASIDANDLKFVPVGDDNGAGYDSFTFLVHDGTDYSAVVSTVSLINATFTSNADGFTYADDIFGTSNPGWASGSYDGAGGDSGGGLRVDLAGGITGGASSGGWSETFNLAADSVVEVTVGYRLTMSSEYEATEYGEAVLEMDGVRYGNDTGSSLMRQYGDGNGGSSFNSGWTYETFTIGLSAGNHTLTLGAYNNVSTATDEWVTTYFDNVTVGTATGNTLTVDVNAVNDVPSGTNKTVSTLEDTDYVFTTGDFGFSDPVEGHGLSGVKITTLPLVGTLKVSGVAVTAGQTVSAVNIGAGNLTFTPVSDDNGAGYTSFTFQVQDAGGTAFGGVDLDSTSNTITVDVTSVNDAPAGANKTVVTDEDTDYVFTTGDFGFADTLDGNALNAVKITTVPGAGSLKLSGSTVAAGQSVSAADIGAGNLVFVPVADENGTGYAGFTFQVQDDGGTANGGVNLDPTPNTITVDVTAVNDAPVLSDKNVVMNSVPQNAPAPVGAVGTLIGNLVDVAGGGGNDNVSDPDTGAATGIVVIAADTGNGSWFYSINDGANWFPLGAVVPTSARVLADDGVTRLYFQPTPAYTGTVDPAITFRAWDQTTGSNGNLVDVLAIGTGNDKTFSSATDTASITVTNINTPPTAANNTVTTDEDVTFTFQVTDFAYSDGDGDPLNKVEITTIPLTGSLELSGVPVVALDEILEADISGNNLKFVPVGDDSGAGYASFTFRVHDGTEFSVSTYTLTVDVNAVNDVPGGSDNTVVTLEDDPHVFVAGDFGFSDPVEGDGFGGVKITTLPSSGSLELSGIGVTAGQVVSAAQVTAGNLAFVPVGDDNGLGYDSFTFQVQDDGGTANGGVDTDPTPNTLTVDVTAVNDAPAGTSNTVSMLEDGTYVFTTGDFGFSDPVEGDVLDGVRITTLPAAGTLKLAGVDVVAGQVIDVVDITGNDLTFEPVPEANGTGYTSFTFQVRDDGGTANGGVDEDPTPNLMTIDVTSVNDEPEGTANTVTTLEDTPYVFMVTDFGLTDPNDSPADGLAGVKMTTLPGLGTLKLSGVAVTAGQTVSAANIVAGNLTFEPVGDANGLGYTSFTFQIQDDGGVANGGVDLDSTAHTMTIDVTAVNDAPSGADKTLSTLEDTAYVFDTTDFGFSDPAEGDSLVGVKITAIPASGSLELSGFAVSAGQVVSAADITAGNLTFTPDPDDNGLANGTFTFQVQDSGGTANGGVDLDISPNTITVDVTAVNDEPSFSTLGNQVVTEDSGPHSVPGFATPLAGGGTDESGQTFSYNISNDNGALFSAAPAIDASGTLTYSLTANASGSATVTVSVTDSGGLLNGGDNTSPDQTFDITVNPENDAPVLDPAGDMVLTTIREGETDPAGDLVSAILASDSPPDRVTDVDTGAVEGIAVKGADNSNGNWQWSTNGGGTWNNFGGVSDNNAVLLDPTAMVRFLPNPTFAGTADLTIRAWDQTFGANGDTGVNITLAGTGGTTAFSLAQETVRVTVDATDVILWMSTTGDVTGSGSPGLSDWSEGEVIGFGEPAFTFGSGTTSGTFGSEVDFDAFGGDVQITGLHAVMTAITFQGIPLQVGDLMFVTADNETLTTAAAAPPPGWTNNQAVNAGDIYVFRPETAGDYSSGYFRFVMAGPGANSTQGISLVERATNVGDTLLPAGSLLFTQSGNQQKNEIWFHDPSGPTTAKYLDGNDIDIPDGGAGVGIIGLELIESSAIIGGVNMTAGNILVTLDNNDNVVGDAPTIGVQKYDIFGLNVTKSTMTFGTTQATAFMVLDGDNVGLNTGTEAVDALTIVIRNVSGNQAPTLGTSGGSVAYTENDPAAIIDAGVNIGDVDSLDFNTGQLRVGFSAGGTANDRLAINHEGVAPGEVGVSGSSVTYGGVTIGSFTGGTSGSDPLVVSFNNIADVTMVQAVARNVTYQNVSDDPSGAARTVRFQVTDGDGGTSPSDNVTVNVTPVNDAPGGADNTVVTLEDTDHVFVTGDFGFTDPLDSDALLGVRITTLPVVGSLELSGVAVTAGQTIDAADITAGDLTFTPVGDASGASYASFTFQVQDDGGVLNGGVDLDPTPNTLTIDVTAVNDEPSGADKTVVTTEDADYTFTTGDFGFSDPVEGDGLSGVKITTLPAAGTIKLSGAAIAAGQTIAVGDISGNDLTFTPVPNASGAGYASFTFQVQDTGGVANGGVDLDSTPNTMTVDVTAVGDTPSAPNAGTLEDTQTALIVIDRHASDGAEVTHFRVSGITNGTLYQADGTTPILDGEYITYAQGQAGVRFTPASNSNANGSFTVESSEDGSTVAAQSGTDTSTIIVTPVGDTPSAPNTNTDEDAQSGAIVINRHASDGAEVSHFRISGITGGTLYHADGTSPISNGDYITFLEGQAGLKFTPSPNSNGNGSFQVESSEDGSTVAAQSGVDTSTITVNPVGDTPIAPNAVTLEDNQSGLIVIDRHASDGAEITHFRVSGIGNGTLYQSDGTTPILNGEYITYAQGQAGVRFTPTSHSNANGSFAVESSQDGSTVAAQSGADTSTIVVTPVGDTPTVANVLTTEDTQSAAIVLGRHAADGAEVTHFRISNITGGTLYQNDGTTVINDGDYILVAEGTAGLEFTPSSNSNTAGSFDVESSEDGSTVAAQSGAATSTITVTPVGDTPTAASIVTTEDIQSAAIVLGRHAADGVEVTHFRISSITGGTLYQNDGTTVINDGDYVTFLEGSTGLRFTPSSNSNTAGSFDVESSEDGSSVAAQSGAATSTISIAPVGDTPTAASNVTTEDTQSAAIVLGRHAADGTEVTHFRISSITGGTLYQNDGTTVISDGDYITFAQGAAGLKFTPSSNSNVAGSFDVESSEDGSTVAAQSGAATSTITITPVGDTPTVASIVTTEDTQSAAIVLGRHAADGVEVTHFRISNITGGTLYQNDGTTVITDGDYITFLEGSTGLKFTPSSNSNTAGSFDVESSEDGSTVAAQSGAATSTITITPVGDTPTAASIVTTEDTQSAAITLGRHAADGAEVTHFRISNITGGTLYQNDGTTVINDGDYVTFLEGSTGLKFTPSSNSNTAGSFDVESSEDGSTVAAQSGAATSTITITPVGDTPTVASILTTEDTQSAAIVLGRHAADGAEVTHFRISSITGGTLYQNDGTTVINDGDHITVLEGSTGLKFTPSSNSNTAGSFDVESSEDGSTAAAQSGTATSTITVTPVGDTPTTSSIVTTEDTQSAAIVLGRHAADGAEVTHFRISSVMGGTLYQNDGTTVISDGDYVTVAQGAAGLKFTPSSNSNTAGSFDVESSEDGSTVAAQSGAATSTITITPVGDTPTVASIVTTEDTQSAAIVLGRNASDGVEVTHFRISNISGGTLYQNDGATVISNGDYIAFAQGALGLKFTPSSNSNAAGSFDVESSEDGTTVAAQSGAATSTISIAPVGDTPTAASNVTTEDTQSAAIVLGRHAADGTEVTHFRISSITGGTLYQNDGTTVISDGDYITFAQGAAGLKFTPSSNSNVAGSFDVESSEDGSTVAAQSGAATSTITITPVGDTPTVASIVTTEDTQSAAIVLGRHAADGVEVTHFRISSIAGGTLHQNDGTTVINDGDYITFAQGAAGLKFTPSSNSNTAGSFDVEASEDGSNVAAQSGTATSTITITPVGDTPTAASIVTTEDTQSAAIILGRNANDGAEVTHFRVSNISGGTLYQNDGTTVINDGDYISFLEGSTGLKFTPSSNSNTAGSFDVESSEDGTTVAAQSGAATSIINITPVGDTPTAASIVTTEDTQSGAIVLGRNANDGAEVTHFRINNISGGMLYQNDGTTAINNGDYITFAQGSTGLKFTPSSNSNTAGSFDVESSEDGSTVAAQSGTATSTITVTPVGDTPTAANIVTDEDTQSAAIVLSRHAADGAEVTHFRISNITGGTLYQNDGTTVINDGDYITFLQGSTGLKFTPTSNSNTAGSFDVESSEDGSTVAAQSGAATSTITVTPVGDTPTAANIVTTEDTQSAAILLGRHAADGAEVTHFRISNITGGTVYQNDGTTVISDGDYITFAQGSAGLKFTPSSNSNTAGSFDAESSEDGTTVAAQSSAATSTITVTPVGDTPTAASIVTTEDTQSGAIVLGRNANDGAEVSHFRISNISGGTLYQDDGTTVINGGDYITFAQGSTGLKFTPTANSNTAGSFDVESSEDGSTVAGQSGTATSTVTITPVGDTPTVADIGTIENIQSGLIVINRHASDGAEVTHFNISNISNGTLYQADGTTPINDGDFITYAEGQAGVRFTPALNSTAPGSFDVESSEDGLTVAVQSGVATSTITVSAANNPPEGADNAVSLLEDAAYTFTVADFGFSDPVEGNALLGVRVSSLPVPGTLTLAGMAVSAGQIVSAADIVAGDLVYTPAAQGSGTGYAGFTFQVRDDGGTLNGGVDTDPTPNTLTIDVTPVGDTPTAASIVTTEDTQSAAIVLGRNANDGAEVTHFRVSNIAGGTLYQNDGTTVINDGDNIAFAQGSTGLKFTPSADSNTAGSFDVESSEDGSTVAAQSGVATSTITITPVGDTPTAASVVTTEDTQSGAIVLGRNANDGAEVTHFRISNITGGTLYQNDGMTAINDGDYISFLEGSTGLGFTPASNSNTAGSFDIESSEDGTTVAAQSGAATSTITITPVGDTPTAASIVTTEDTQSAAIALGRNANDGAEVTHFRISNITGGTLYQNDGTTVINHGDYVTFAEGAAGLKFTPSANSNTAGSFDVESSEDGTTVAAQSGAATSTITITPVGDAPTTASIVTAEDTQSAAIVLGRNANDGAEVTHFRISNISGGTLYLNDGTTVINDGDYIAFAQGSTGLKFTPTANSNMAGSFDVEASEDGATVAAQSGIATATITITPVGDTPTAASIVTTEDSQSGAIVLGRDANDGAEVTHFRISNISGGALYQNDGTTVINDGDYISFAHGNAGLRFTPAANANAAGSFDVESSEDGTMVAAQSGTATSTVTITPVGDTPTVASIVTIENTQSGLIVIDRHASDGAEVTHFRITGIANGTLFQADGTTPINDGDFITYAEGQAGIRFTPALNSTAPGSFDVESSEDGLAVAAQSGVATSTITVSAANNPPQGADSTISMLEDGAYTFSVADFGFSDPVEGDALSGVELTTLPTVGTLELAGVAVSPGQTVTAADIVAGELVYTPAAQGSGTGYAGLTFQVRDDGGTANGGVDTDPTPNTLTIDVTPVGDTPTVASVATTEDTQSGAIVLGRNADDGAEVTHFRVSNISGGTLYQNDGTTAINDGDYITFAEGAAGLKFTPSANSNTAGSFDVESSEDGATVAAQSGTATSTITVTPVGDTPTATSVATTEDTQSAAIVLGRNANDGAEVTHFRISNVTGGTLYRNDGTTVINDGDYITLAQGALGLKFTPLANSNAAGSFDVESSEDGATVAVQSGVATGTITIIPVGDTPTVASVATTEDTQSGAIVLGRNADDGAEVTHFRVSNISGGTLYQNDGTTAINDGDYITFAEGAAGLKFAPSANSTTAGSFDVESSEDGATVAAQSGTATSNIAVAPANDAPTGANGAVTVLEDTPYVFDVVDFGFSDPLEGDSLAGVSIITLPGAGALTLAGVGVNAGDFITAGDIAAGGLSFLPASDTNGMANASFDFQVRDDGGTANGGVDTDPTQKTLTMDVLAVNDAPGFTQSGDQSVPEDSGPHSVVGFATPVAGGGADESGQTLTFDVSNSNAALFSVEPAIDAGGNLTYALAVNAVGSAAVTVSVTDSGGTADGGVDTSSAQVFNITVIPVNDAPSFVTLGNQLISEDSGAHSVAGFAAALAGGGVDEAGQTFTYTVGNDNLALFSVGPSIDPNGNLSYTPASDAHGTATVTVSVRDSGGTANGGLDNSTSQTFDIVVAPVADTPAITNASTNEDTQTNAGLVVTANAVDGAEVTHYKVTGIVGGTLYRNDGTTVINPGDFISIGVGLAGLKFTPSADFHGTGGFDVQASTSAADAGLGGGITSALVVVNPVSDAPSGSDGAVVTLEDSTYAFTVADFGFNDPKDGDSLIRIKVVTLPNAGELTLSGSGPVNAGDIVTVADIAAGRLRFASAANANGTGYASFTFQVQDDGGTGNGGMDTDPTANVLTIDVAPVNDAPMTTPAELNVGEDSKPIDITRALLAGDTDIDTMDRLVVSAVDATGTLGRVTLTGGVVHYHPGSRFQFLAAGEAATDSFSYTVSDGNGGTATATVTVTVEGADEPLGLPPDDLELVASETNPPESSESAEQTDEASPTQMQADGAEPRLAATLAPTPLVLLTDDPEVDFTGAIADRDAWQTERSDNANPPVGLMPRLASLKGVEPLEPSLPQEIVIHEPLQNKTFVDALDDMRDEFEESAEAESIREHLLTETAIGITLTLSAGFVTWVVKAGSLMASFLSMSPLWQQMDPLPILSAQTKRQSDESDDLEDTREKGREEQDEKRVESLFDGDR